MFKSQTNGEDTMTTIMAPKTVIVSLASCLLLVGCDLFDDDEERSTVDGVPPERLVAMIAGYENARHLVVADLEDPSRYEVLREAGDEVDGTCFSPNKRRILFADQSGGIVSSRAPLKLYNLDTDEVRTLNGAPAAATHGGTNGRCVWSADGSGFYYQAAGGAGATLPTYYDLESGEARSFGSGGMRFYGRKGEDTLLVRTSSPSNAENEESSFPCFVGAQTGEVFECAKNEHLKFVPWEDERRGGWKYGAFSLTYDAPPNLIAFMRSVEEKASLAVTDFDGSSLTTLTSGAQRYTDLAWGPGPTVIFSEGDSSTSPRVYVADVESGNVRLLIQPNAIDGANWLKDPDF